jgi:hypothetical protein
MSVMEDELKKTDLDSTDFLKGMLKGIDTIVKESNGSCTNEELFWTISINIPILRQKRRRTFL